MKDSEKGCRETGEGADGSKTGSGSPPRPTLSLPSLPESIESPPGLFYDSGKTRPPLTPTPTHTQFTNQGEVL